jgi:hypothetical protein
VFVSSSIVGRGTVPLGCKGTIETNMSTTKARLLRFVCIGCCTIGASLAVSLKCRLSLTKGAEEGANRHRFMKKGRRAYVGRPSME